MDVSEWTTAGLWLAVVASGVYHGVNPGMGWPLVVSAGLMGRGRRDLALALIPLALGHLVAMLTILLPFAMMTALIAWQHQVRLGASLMVLGFGVYKLINQRHPRALARIPPAQLGLWSFAVAMAHGAGLMLLPIYLGLCTNPAGLGAGHAAAAVLMTQNLTTAVFVSVVHALAMVASGGAAAFAVHAWLGLKFVSKSWFNLDTVWAVSLALVGAIGLALA